MSGELNKPQPNLRAPVHGRVLALDGLRGAAVVMVMVYHCTVIKPMTWYEHWFCVGADLGRFGVDLFFVLSGFLITSVLWETRLKQRFFRNFYIRRALRIFPLYYALIALGVAASPLLLRLASRGGEHLGHSTESWFWYLTYCTNFLVAIRNAWPHGLLDVSWSLCIEEHFYIVWPVLVFAARRRSLQLMLGFVIVSSVAVRALLLHWGLSRLQIYVLTFTRLDGLAFGSLLALSVHQLSANVSQLRQNAWRVFFVTVVALAALLVSGQTGFNSLAMSVFGYTLMSGMFASLLAVVLVSPAEARVTKLLERRWLQTLGQYSYALYLMHLPIRSVIRDYLPFGNAQFRRLNGFALFGQFAFYGVSAACSLLVAWVSWNLLEKRFLALKDRLAPPTPSGLKDDPRLQILPKSEEALP